MGSIVARNGRFYSFLGWLGMGDKHYLRSLEKVIIIYFILFFEINKETHQLAPYKFLDPQVILI